MNIHNFNRPTVVDHPSLPLVLWAGMSCNLSRSFFACLRCQGANKRCSIAYNIAKLGSLSTLQQPIACNTFRRGTRLATHNIARNVATCVHSLCCHYITSTSAKVMLRKIKAISGEECSVIKMRNICFACNLQRYKPYYK